MKNQNLLHENNNHIVTLESYSDVDASLSEIDGPGEQSLYEGINSHLDNMGDLTKFPTTSSDTIPSDHTIISSDHTIIPNTIPNTLSLFPNYTQIQYDNSSFNIQQQQQQQMQCPHPIPQQPFNHVYQQQYPQFYFGYEGISTNYHNEYAQTMVKPKMPPVFYLPCHLYDLRSGSYDNQYNYISLHPPYEQQPHIQEMFPTANIKDIGPSTFNKSTILVSKLRESESDGGDNTANSLQFSNGENGENKKEYDSDRNESLYRNENDGNTDSDNNYDPHHNHHHKEATTNFCCPNCDLKFSKQSELQSHLVVHSALRPYVCKVCGSKCKRKSDWLRHMKNHKEIQHISIKHQCGGIVNGQHWGCNKKYSRGDARRKHWKGKNGEQCVAEFCLATLNVDTKLIGLKKRINCDVIQDSIKHIKSRYKDTVCDIYNDMATNVEISNLY